MPRSFIAPLITIAALVAVIGGWLIFAKEEASRFSAVHRVLHQRSVLKLRYEVSRARGPISREVYTMLDEDGKSQTTYAVTDRRGTTASFSLPVRGYDVSFLFQQLVLDGVWEVHTEPARGDLSKAYLVYVEQTVDTRSGSRTVGFTDPHYWAVEGGHQFAIKLDRSKPVPDLVNLTATSTAEPRLQKIVNDFAGFSPPGFRRSVEAARAKLARS